MGSRTQIMLQDMVEDHHLQLLLEKLKLRKLNQAEVDEAQALLHQNLQQEVQVEEENNKQLKKTKNLKLLKKLWEEDEVQPRRLQTDRATSIMKLSISTEMRLT